MSVIFDLIVTTRKQEKWIIMLHRLQANTTFRQRADTTFSHSPVSRTFLK